MNGLAPRHLMPESSITWTAEEVAEWEIEEALRFAPGTHPLDQVSLYVPFSLYGWQHDAIAAGARPKSRCALSTCNFSGKTSVVIPAFGMAIMCAFPGAQILSTSGDAQQVKEQLFEQQLRPLVEQRRFKDNGWKIKTGDSFKVTAPNGSSWLGYVTAKDSTFEGFHSYWREDEKTGEKRYCPLVFLIDEAKSVGDGVHEAIRRIDPDFMIALSTPGKENGWFYEALDPDGLKAAETTSGDLVEWNIYKHPYEPNPLHDYQQEYDSEDGCIWTYRRMLTQHDCPHLLTKRNQRERRNLEHKFGRNSAYIKSMLYGEFQRADDYSLIYTDEDLALMRAAMRGANKPVGNDVRAASDTSGGGDKQPLMVRIGTKIVLQERGECPTEIEHAELLARRLKSLGIDPWQFTIDGGGIGAAVANYMEKRLDYSGLKRAQANTGPRFKFEYRDKYTETHFLIKELLSAGVLVLDYNEALLKQMRCRRFIEMEIGLKIKTEPKPAHRKREKSSPDELDTLVYLLYDFDWSLIAKYTEEGGAEVPESAPTEMERKAEEASRGGGRIFKGLRSASYMRERIVTDQRRVAGLRIGR